MRIVSGPFVARLAQTPKDVIQAQKLRYEAFIAPRLGYRQGIDVDEFDDNAQHVLIERNGTLISCFRFMHTIEPEINTGYAAQFYDLSPLLNAHKSILEIGRFCVRSINGSGPVLRLAWAMMLGLAGHYNAGLLVGCTSFRGAHPEKHGLSRLVAHIGAPHVLPIPRVAAALDLREQAISDLELPRLLQSYLAMGAWVGGHVIIDTALDTLHVFTAVETAKIPAARLRRLNQICGT